MDLVQPPYGSHGDEPHIAAEAAARKSLQWQLTGWGSDQSLGREGLWVQPQLYQVTSEHNPASIVAHIVCLGKLMRSSVQSKGTMQRPEKLGYENNKQKSIDFQAQ